MKVSDAEAFHNINPGLLGLALPIEMFRVLDDNPRSGDVEAVAASYEEFGQNKPIVVRPLGADGLHEVLSGNHQFQAARDVLGWTHIAAVTFVGDDKHGLAYAITDNQTFERGHTDPIKLHDALEIVYTDYADMFAVIGWDQIEMAAIDEQYDYHQQTINRDSGYSTPTLHRPPGEPYQAPEASVAPIVTQNADGGQRLDAPAAIDTNAAVTLGATASGAAGSKSVVQYTLVFDDAAQQRRWYDFVRWLRNDPEMVGDSTAERLMSFLEERADF